LRFTDSAFEVCPNQSLKLEANSHAYSPLAANKSWPQSGVTFALVQSAVTLLESIVVQTVFLRHER